MNILQVGVLASSRPVVVMPYHAKGFAGGTPAALQAQPLLIDTLTAAGRGNDARNEQASVAAKCAELGLSRLLVDAGLA